MSLRNKWLAGLGFSCAFLVAIALLLYWLLVPALISSRLSNALRERGLDQARFSLESVGLSVMSFRDLQLDASKRLTIGRIELRYELSGLLHGHIDEIVFSNAVWHVGLSSSGELDWGPIKKLTEGGPAAPIAVDRVRWVASELLLDGPSGTLRVPFEGQALTSERGTELDIRAHIFDEALRLRGSLDADGRAGRLHGLLGDPEQALDASDRVSLQASFQESSEQVIVDLKVRGKRPSLRVDAAGRSWTLLGLFVNVDLQVRGDELRDVAAEVSVGSLQSGDTRLRLGRLTLVSDGPSLLLEASAALDLCRLGIKARLPARYQHWQPEGPFEASWYAAGPLPSAPYAWLGRAGIVAKEARIIRASGRALASYQHGAWQAQLYDTSMELAATSLVATGARLRLARARALLRLRGHLEAGNIELVLSRSSQLRVGELRWRGFSISPLRREGFALVLDLPVRDATLRWRRQALEVEADRIDARLHARARYQDRVSLGGLTGTLPMAIAAMRGVRILPTRLQATDLRIRTLELAKVTVNLRGSPRLLQVQLQSAITPTATIKADLSLDARSSLLHCPMHLTMAQARIKDNDALARWLEERVPARLRGRVELDARADPCSLDDDWRGFVGLDDVSVRSTGHRLGVSGLRGRISFVGLSPVRTEGWQELSWAKTQLGDQHLLSGVVVFRTRLPRVIEIQRSRLELGGGTLSSSAFVADLAQLDIDTTIVGDRIRLGKWLPVVSAGHAQGSGTLSGELHLRMQWQPQLHLQLLGASLRSEGGHFAVKDRRWLRSAIERNTSEFSLGSDRSELIKDRVIGALADFDFQSLALRIEESRNHGPQVLHVATSGTGRKIPQELHLQLRVVGFEDLINPGLRAWLAKEP